MLERVWKKGNPLTLLVGMQTQGLSHLSPIYREGAQPHPSSENWIKDILGTALPTRARPTFPHSQSLPSGSFTSLLSLSFRGQTEWKPQLQKTNQTVHLDHSCTELEKAMVHVIRLVSFL